MPIPTSKPFSFPNSDPGKRDIVVCALGEVLSREMIAQVILGKQKFINTEVSRAIAGLSCFRCKTAIDNLRSLKCHHRAYAESPLAKALKQMEAARKAP